VPTNENDVWKAILYLASSINQLRGVITEIGYRRTELGLTHEQGTAIHTKLMESFDDSKVVMDLINKHFGGGPDA
jgi:hypothetical protein